MASNIGHSGALIHDPLAARNLRNLDSLASSVMSRCCRPKSAKTGGHSLQLFKAGDAASKITHKEEHHA
jgi:hypothetical protein